MSLPAEFVYGLYLGLLTGIIPALVAGVLGFVFRYFTGVTLPGLGVVVLAVAIAGVNGGLLGLVDPTIQQTPALLVALVVVMMLSLYAHNQGDALGATMPRRFSLRTLRRQTLSADVVSVVAGMGRVTITPAGEVDDIEGYPSLPADLRAELTDGAWDFPADVPIAELERRLADRLRTDYDLADVAVAIDEQGRARISAAPPMGGLSRRVPDGQRAVSVPALVPTGIARGEYVTILTAEGSFDGTVVSAQSTGAVGVGIGHSPDAVTDGGTQPETLPVAPTAPTTTGGDGRVTVAVPRSRAPTLLAAYRGRVIVRSRGNRREFELLSLFRRAGKRVERITVGPESSLAGSTVGEAAVRQTHDVELLAVRTERGAEPGSAWTVSPGGSVALSAGDDLFVVGRREALDRFRGEVA